MAVIEESHIQHTEAGVVQHLKVHGYGASLGCLFAVQHHLGCVFIHRSIRIHPTAAGAGAVKITVAQGGDNSLCSQNLITDRAVLALGQTSVGAVGSNSSVGDLGMTLSGDSLLSNQNGITAAAVLALGQAGGGTGSGDGLVDDFNVTQSVNSGLLLGDHVTDSTLCALSQAGSGTGRSNSSQGLLSMALGGYHLLGLGDGITDSTLFTLGQTGAGAGSSYGLVDDFNVAQSVNHVLLHGNGVTNRTLLAFRQAGFGTCGCLGGQYGFLMTGGSNGLGIAVTAKGTGIGSVTVCSAGRSRYAVSVLMLGVFTAFLPYGVQRGICIGSKHCTGLIGNTARGAGGPALESVACPCGLGAAQRQISTVLLCLAGRCSATAVGIKTNCIRIYCYRNRDRN